MMEPMESSIVPPGFRFHPTDEELVGYYLKKKVTFQKIDLDVIKYIDLYRIEPWDLQERCRIGYEEQNEWYFFSHKDKKYPMGTRTNRATMAGFWKATARDKAIYDKMKQIGMRKTLVFYKGRAPNGHKSDWIMHEYRLETDENGPSQEEGWVVCRAFKKKTTAQSNHNKAMDQRWDSSNYLYDQTRMFSPSMESSEHRYQCHYLPRSPPNFMSSPSPNTFLPKQELDRPFLQLPQLESPSLSLLKRHIGSNTDNELKDIEQMKQGKSNTAIMENVTDWRALDKFVASQLSHDNEHAGDHDRHNHNHIHHGIGSRFGSAHDHQEVVNNDGSEDIALFLLQNSPGGRDEKGEGDKLISEFLASTSESELGICIFDK